MIIIDKRAPLSKDNVEMLNTLLHGSLKSNVIHMVNGTGNKLQIIDNWSEARMDLPKGIVVEVYTKDDQLIFQSVQGSVGA